MKVKSKKVYDAPRFKNIREVLENSVKLYPDCTAFILKEKKENEVTYKNITFTQLQEEVNSLGTALISLGLKGKRTAIISPNRYEWCVSYLAILNGVGIAVPLDKSLPEEELIGSLERSKADAVIFDKKYEETVSTAKNNTLVFADRFPFLYLTRDYGIKYYAAFPGCSAETEASFETVMFLSGKIDELGLKYIMTTESPVAGIAETVRENTGDKNAEILALDSMQSLTAEDGQDYISVMEKNLEVLEKALD